jgi:hypothetical protein
MSSSADVEQCDRELPTCNHCSWANRECKYTPLPTPAHRGIPRCDRCRFHNLKVCTVSLAPSPNFYSAEAAICSAIGTCQSAIIAQKTMGPSAIILQRSATKYQRTTHPLSRTEHQYPTLPKVRPFWSQTCPKRKNIPLATGSRSIRKARGGICPLLSTRSIPPVPRIQRMKTTVSMEIFL